MASKAAQSRKDSLAQVKEDAARLTRERLEKDAAENGITLKPKLGRPKKESNQEG